MRSRRISAANRIGLSLGACNISKTKSHRVLPTTIMTSSRNYAAQRKMLAAQVINRWNAGGAKVISSEQLEIFEGESGILVWRGFSEAPKSLRKKHIS